MGKIIHNYKCGQKHITLGKNCEDRTYAMTLNDVSVIALADGAGSEKYTHSAIGAECVVEVACNFLCKNFDRILATPDDECKNAFVSICHSELSQKANELGLDSIMYLSSTLLAVAVKGNDTIIFHIGDGVIGKYTIDGFKVVSAPDNGEFVGTTYFMTLADAANRLEMIREHNNDVTAYFMMSDGVSEYVYDEYTHSFTDAVANFINMADDVNGSALLGDAMQKYIIDTNPTSDDCSFACLKLVASRAQTGGYIPSKEHNPDAYAEYSPGGTSNNLEMPTTPIQNPEALGQAKPTKRQKKLSPVVVLIIIFAFVLAIVLGRVVGGIFSDKPDEDAVANDIYSTVPAYTEITDGFTDNFEDEATTEEDSSETTEETETTEKYEETVIITTTQPQKTQKPSTTEKQTTTSKPVDKNENNGGNDENVNIGIPDAGLELQNKKPTSNNSTNEMTEEDDKKTGEEPQK